jgi:hypothetical protein
MRQSLWVVQRQSVQLFRRRNNDGRDGDGLSCRGRNGVWLPRSSVPTQLVLWPCTINPGAEPGLARHGQALATVRRNHAAIAASPAPPALRCRRAARSCPSLADKTATRGNRWRTRPFYSHSSSRPMPETAWPTRCPYSHGLAPFSYGPSLALAGTPSTNKARGSWDEPGNA